MPVYEYKCTVCQERFEVEQSFRDEPLTTLPGGDDHDHQLKKVFSPVGISFRGGGFYRNEARSPKKPADSSSSDGSGTTDSGSSTAKEVTSTKESTPTPSKASSTTTAD